MQSEKEKVGGQVGHMYFRVPEFGHESFLFGCLFAFLYYFQKCVLFSVPYPAEIPLSHNQ